MRRLAVAAGALGLAAVIALLVWSGTDAVRHAVAAALWVLPPVLAVHAGQLLLSALAWRVALGFRPGVARIFALRLIREGVNSLLPLANLAGNAAAIRLMARDGIALPTALAGTTLDITVEAAAQAVFTLTGIAVLAAELPEAARGYLWGGGVIAFATVAGLLAVTLGGPALAEAAAARIGVAGRLAGLRGEARRLLSRPGPLSLAFALQVAAWSLGTAEAWLMLRALGAPVGWGAALVIESLGQAARSAGFAVPGSAGVQEGGFVAACALFGLPAETGFALSMLKRVRELIVGGAGLLAWRVN